MPDFRREFNFKSMLAMGRIVAGGQRHAIGLRNVLRVHPEGRLLQHQFLRDRVEQHEPAGGRAHGALHRLDDVTQQLFVIAGGGQRLPHVEHRRQRAAFR
jgi:hypothetical protein